MRVASGDAVGESAARPRMRPICRHFLMLRRALRDTRRLSEQTELNALDMEKLNKDIDSSFTELIEASGKGDFSNVNQNIEELENKLASKQILKDGTIDLTAKFNELGSKK